MRISDWSSDVCYSDLVMGGLSLGGRGNLVVYGEYTERDSLLAGNRDFARRGIATLPIGGNFTDVASGRTFSYDASGNFTLTPQSTDYTPDFLLVQPLRRINASALDRKSTRLNSSH